MAANFGTRARDAMLVTPAWTAAYMKALLAAADCCYESEQFQEKSNELYVEGQFKASAKAMREAVELLFRQADMLALAAGLLEPARDARVSKK